MKLPLPSLNQRKTIVRYLDNFYDDPTLDEFDKAITLLAEFYGLPKPVIKWYEYIDRGRLGGATFEDGTIHLQHPENWKASKSKINGKRKWVRVVLHEWAHYYLWCDWERKAELYERRFIRATRT